MKTKVNRKIKIGFPSHFCTSHTTSERLINIEQVKDFLQDRHLKITKSRLDLLKVFLNNETHYLTMTTILAKLRKINAKVNVSSVYNNLEILCRIGAIRPNLNISTNETTFELLLNAVPHIHAYVAEDERETALEINCELHDAVIEQFQKQGFIVEDYLIQAVVRYKDPKKDLKTNLVVNKIEEK
ncbi:Fe2+ or Zn2+ uptake regulation protein [Mycoplasmoides fastidiosum]|uniref:Fe2+ or Zn2+ uptake regulation protein n=1 Tax=Mycoplasmoides fastidiosum TaxID=92758 RepID=A0ABU0LZZ2_9BACT|nr:transcriptional repressor [Mycoplasmoides fastidiosum]MDQ0514259.1 Fe2+ or Zn2+ uptake regulation protein [Mycoplasmoides fastidiosum]UUD37333.1 transcriptional repressor [Mycoplasmoides fastidiosum]